MSNENKPLTCGECDKVEIGRVYADKAPEVMCPKSGEYHQHDYQCDQVKKPLAEWTLDEVQKECAGRINCYQCPLRGTVCQKCARDSNSGPQPPIEWSIPKKPRFTEDEVADMTAVHRIFRSAVVGRLENSKAYTSNRAMSINEAWSDADRITYLPERLFPSLSPGQSVEIAEIIGEEPKC